MYFAVYGAAGKGFFINNALFPIHPEIMKDW